MSTVEDFRRWTFAVARDLVASAPGSRLDVDDVAQEGLLAVWEAEASFDPARGALAAYVTLCARRRMRDVVLRGRPLTGEEAVRGKVADRRAPAAESLDAIAEDDVLPRSLVAVPDDAVTLDGIRVRAAVADLEPADRLAVFRRFWLGEPMTGKERARWSAHVRPRLEEVLAA